MPIARAGVAMVILTAGLWPFQPFPENDVQWIAGESGLQFGQHGIVGTESALPIEPGSADDACTLEVWMEPESGDDNNTFLVISTREQAERFRLVQYGDEVLIQREVLQNGRVSRVAEIELPHVFRAGKLLYLAIAADKTETTAYVDGRVAKRSSHFGMTRQDLSGRLYFGTATTRFATWQGELKGIRILGRRLRNKEVAAIFATSITERASHALEAEVSAYWFREGQGSAAKSEIAGSPNLTVPRHFFLPGKPFLSPPWKEFVGNWEYVKDIVLNVAGFMPLGFAFLPYLAARFGESGRMWKTVLFGFAVSLMIEVLQWWIPSRTSGMTDLITNTTGAYLGALLCTWEPIQRILRKAEARKFRFHQSLG